MKQIFSRFQQKHDTEANWLKATNFAPLEGELIIYDPDDNYDYPRFKVGIWDGESEKTDDMLVSNLPFATSEQLLESGNSENSIQQTGTGAISIGEGATAFGKNTTAYGPTSFIEGASTSTAQIALDIYNKTNSSNYQLQDIDTSNLESFWGDKKDWNKNFSFARTLPTTDIIDGVALEGGAHVEGLLNVGIGSGVHAEGYHTWCLANAAHTEGYGTKALADGAHAEGGSSTAKKPMAHAEGQNSIADGVAAHAEGYSYALENFAHSEGYLTTAIGKHSHTEGWGTVATADDSHVQGKFNIEDTEKRYAHIQGAGTQVTPKNIHTIDWDGNAWFIGQIRIGGKSYDDGQVIATQAHVTTSINSAISGLTIKKGTGGSSLALNMGTCLAGGYASVALGHGAETTAAHAIALGQNAHAYGANSTAIGQSEASAQHAFAVGYNAQATSNHAIALGYSAKAKEQFACAIGHGSTASGKHSFAQGNVATASGEASVAFGEQTKATEKWQMAVGAFNQTDADALFLVGNGTGTSNSQRSNAFVVKKDGTGYLNDKKIATEDDIGDIENALDSIIAIQESLIGGNL